MNNATTIPKSTSDASPLTTSSEPESFDTWTMITSKIADAISNDIPSPPLTPEEPLQEDEPDTENELDEDVVKHSNNRQSEVEDISDGISIISECESVGRISPHPELRKHLADLNTKLDDVIEPTLRNRKSSKTNELSLDVNSHQSADTFHHVKPLVKKNRRSRKNSEQNLEIYSDDGFARPLRYMYNILVICAIVILFTVTFSHIREHKAIKEELNKKIFDLELRNSILSAELINLRGYIESLGKTQKETTHDRPNSNSSKKKEKKTKVWSGAGEPIESFDFPETNSKESVKCEPNGIYIDGKCTETPLPDTNTDYDDDKPISESYRKFLRSQGLTDNDIIKLYSEEVAKKFGKRQQKKNENTPREHHSGKYDGKKDEKYEKRGKEFYKKHKHHDGSGDKQERYRKERSGDDSGESYERYSKEKSDEDFNGSGRRYKNSKDNKKFNKHSSSDYENVHIDDDDHDWLEKRMEHRANARKHDDKHRHDNNWYIERGDSREEARIFEH